MAVEILKLLNQENEDDFISFYKSEESDYRKTLSHYSSSKNWETHTLSELQAVAWDIPKDVNGQMKFDDSLNISGEIDPIRKELEDSFSSDTLTKVARDGSFFLAIKGENTLRPVRISGLSSWAYRAGWSASSNILGGRTLHRNSFPAAQRASWLNIGSANSDEEITLYCPDNTIWFIGSERYIPLSPEAGSNELLDWLNNHYPNHEFRGAHVSHTLLYEDHFLSDEEEEDSFSLRLSDILGYEITTKFFVRFSTGNIGDTTMKAQLFCELTREFKGMPTHVAIIPMGNAEQIYHLSTRPHEISGKSGKDKPDTFRERLEKLGKSIKDNEKLIEKLGNMQIEHIQGFVYWWYIRNVSKSGGKDAREYAREFALEHSTASVIEVFLYFIEMTGEKKGTDSPAGAFAWIETVSKLLWDSSPLSYDNELPPEL